MTGPLTDQQLAEMQQRHDAARLGPWYREPRSALGEFGVVNCHGDLLGAIELAPDELSFVLAARMDMPALLADNARLRAERDRLLAFASWTARNTYPLTEVHTAALTAIDSPSTRAALVDLAQVAVETASASASAPVPPWLVTHTGAPACTCGARPVHQTGCDTDQDN